MSKIKLIAIDMDGTLLNDDEVVTDYTKEVLQRAQDEGIHVVISTGRPLAHCITYVKDLKLSSYIITSNGAEIYTVDEQLIEQHIMPAEKIEKLWDIGSKKNLDMWLIATDEVYSDGSEPSDFHQHDWLKMGYGDLTVPDKKYVMKQLDQFPGLEITNSLPTNIEVNEAGVNKAQGISTLCDLIGITMDQVLAVGDSLNDFEMINKVGTGVAMGNAQDEIKDIANHVTSTNNEDGVAKAIERLALS